MRLEATADWNVRLKRADEDERQDQRGKMHETRDKRQETRSKVKGACDKRQETRSEIKCA